MKDIAGDDVSWIDELFPVPNSAKHRAKNLLTEMIALESVSTDLSTEDAQGFGYRPYPAGAFCSLLHEAVKVVPPHFASAAKSFLEVGCGTGTKLVLANKIFDLMVYGFDKHLDYFKASQDLVHKYGTQHPISYIWRQDVKDFHDWKLFDIIFLNRPLRDNKEQLALEEEVYDRMLPGSVLILGNGLSSPHDWRLLARGVVAAAYQKVCGCDDIERKVNSQSEIVLICRQCERDITIPARKDEEEC
jgi:SAM-dependent methyltransferase